MTLLVAALAFTLGAAAQSVSGIGFALVSGPLLFTVFGAREGVRVAVVLSMLVNAGVLVREHRAVMWRRVMPVLVTALAVTPLLVHLLEGAHPRLLRGAATIEANSAKRPSVAAPCRNPPRGPSA